MDIQEIAEMLSQMGANQAKGEAERKADREMIADMGAKIDTNQVQLEESLKEAMRVAVSAIEGKMEAIVHSTRSERDKKIQHWNENVTERQEIPKEGARSGKAGV
jgi:hypothetical protein